MPETPLSILSARNHPAVPVVPRCWTFPPEPGSVARARRAVVDALSPDCCPEVRDDLALVVSELVTNAIRHGAEPDHAELVELVLWPVDGCYWLAVSDPGEGLPHRAPPSTEATGGRGLPLVDALTVTRAIVPRPVRGKSVVVGLRLRAGA
ncbi:ATP-binding protein [Streptomyces sp. ST2-7A]|uniref:ATP-binding protein n=1 Tax=Streptomyces sp. ST2-7A TaxID=2907214 RepID=UPI001F1C8CCF|nr:ATP-binding protein [Streptomyces sp. ST2-7A]MCE7082312.1 ATP-binding protein [Streptomyces sp. ST2-7A]